MPETMTTNLGRVITRLGLEDKFLQNGELQNYSLAQRAAIANEIIAEKLRLGRWPAVVNMIWGGFGKADVLYEGDRKSLRQQILESAQQTREMPLDVLKTLAEEGEYDFIFDLATGILGLTYNGFVGALNNIPKSYFEGPEGSKRSSLFDQTAGRKALAEKKYSAAFAHFKEMGDTGTIEEIFGAVLDPKTEMPREEDAYRSGLLERIASSDYSKQEDRLKRIFMGFASGEIKMDAAHAFELFQRHRVQLSEREKATFYGVLAEKLRSYDLRTRFDSHDRSDVRDPELQLLWARKHAESEPNISYGIFSEQEYAGEELRTALVSGLKKKKSERESQGALSPGNVRPEHLRMVYNEMSFELQTQISRQLEDRTELARLSQIAEDQGNLREAYELWVGSGNGFEGEYINSLRTRLIQAEIDEETKKDYGWPSFYFINNLDKQGHIQAFDAVMQHARGKRRGAFLYGAHDLILLQGDTERLEKVRKAMVSFNPRWALHTFMSSSYKHGRDEGMKDPVGFEYALGLLAEREGVQKDQLRTLVGKYGIGS